MDAKHKHFMACVTLIDAREAVLKAIEEVRGNMAFTAVTHIKIAIQKLADAQAEIAQRGLK